ncbi:exopolysaccharide Pel transporter PelG [Microvirga calopogonii]|uniref:exopolysaccharide Pel transporter PelG n=1 Tax=Microvirga calopogonii TaxID=2078013 RepID=UPI000E0D5027|nr:exopolysaccharide Pel transporter PelG [Microvirga calopogonii]
MAGVGFALRTLVERDDLSAQLKGYGHAAVVAAGPWLFTVLALAGLEITTRGVLGREELSLVTSLMIYNFSFSLVFSGPIVMVLTRHLADCLYARQAEDVPGVLVGALTLLWGVQLLIGTPFIVIVLDLSAVNSVLALVGFLVTGGIWLACVFLSALKNFGSISFAFALGMLIAFAGGTYLSPMFAGTGALAGLTLGFAVILYVLLGCILAEYPYKIRNPFGFFPSFQKYWDLACVGLFYNAAIWVDKWVMWLSPDGQAVTRGLITNPSYDSSMFLAYLTIVPALVLFLVSVETSFFERYVTFYRDVQNHATLQKIRHNHRLILNTIGQGTRNITVVQGVICYLALLVAPGLIGLAKGGIELVSIFRFGVLGAFFHTLLLFAMILLAYFDLRRILLGVTGLFFASNAILTLVFIPLGAPWTGYGYFLASLLSFVVACLASIWCIKRLPYMTFIANNPGIR